MQTLWSKSQGNVNAFFWPSFSHMAWLWLKNIIITIFFTFIATFALGFASVFMKWKPALVAQSVDCPIRGRGGHGFYPGLPHTQCCRTAPVELGLARKFRIGWAIIWRGEKNKFITLASSQSPFYSKFIKHLLHPVMTDAKFAFKGHSKIYF